MDGKLIFYINNLLLARKGQERPGRPGEARRGQERPGEARRGQERPGEATRGQERPGEAMRGQGRPGEARRGQERPGEAIIVVLLAFVCFRLLSFAFNCFFVCFLKAGKIPGPPELEKQQICE